MAQARTSGLIPSCFLSVTLSSTLLIKREIDWAFSFGGPDRALGLDTEEYSKLTFKLPLLGLSAFGVTNSAFIPQITLVFPNLISVEL